jgi:predicted nucleotidyltransferase
MKEKVIYKLKVGSQLYGTSTPESDTDYGGVFLPTSKQLLGIHKIKELDLSTNKSNTKNTKDDIDEKYMALDNFLYLLSQNNPTLLEYLYPSEDALLQDSEIMKELRDNADKIITKRVWKSFSGYAMAQKKKLMTKRERFLNLQKGIKLIENSSWDQTDKKVLLDEVTASLLNETMKYYKSSKDNCNSFTKGHNLKVVYEKLIAEYDKYGYRLKSDSFKKLLYDCKFGQHLLRLLHEGRELLETGKLTFPISGKAHTDIMRVRNEEVSYEELLTLYQEYYKLCEEAADKTTLRDKPDFKWIDKFQHRVYLKHIKEENE